MHSHTEKRLLQLILTLFLIIGTTYALLTPPFEASDELWHYPMIRHLADGNPLPIQVYDPAQAGPWKQEASQPPLYYYLGAALTFWVDTSDMPQVRWLNPHVDNGIITTDGNTNLAIHPTDWSNWQGTLLAIRLVRLLSVLLGACTVYLTYLIGREVAPNRPEIPLGAAAINAFTPMFLFISGAVNNDNLAIPLASLGVLLLIRLIQKPSHHPLRDVLLIGTIIGTAVLTKQGTIALLPLSAGTLAIHQYQQNKPQNSRDWLLVFGRTIAHFLLLLLPILLIAGWWYWRNLQLYGDLLGWSAFIAVLGQRETAAPLAQLWDERWGFMLSYWGLFGGVNIPLWRWVYYALNALPIAAILGFPLYLIKTLRHTKLNLHRPLHTLFNLVLTHFPLVITLLFSSGVIYGLIQWATTTWSSQGRLVFTAISTLNILLVLGLVGWLPPRPSRWLLTTLILPLITLSALTPWLIIQPAYAAPIQTTPTPTCTLTHCLDTAIFGDHLQLTSYQINTPPAGLQVGGWVDVTLEWHVLAPTDRNWSIFVHLNDPILGQPIAQRDMYPAQGLRPTSLLQPHQQLINHYRLHIPPTAVSPADLQLTVGLYDFHTCKSQCERLPLKNGGDALSLATLPLAPRNGNLPNPTNVNFANLFQLRGYEITPRRTTATQTINLTLYWQPHPQANIQHNYTFYAQIIGQDTTRWASQDLAQPTTTWPPNQIQTITMPLTLRPDTPANLYPIRIGIYLNDPTTGIQNLQRVTTAGRLTDDFLILTPIRID